MIQMLLICVWINDEWASEACANWRVWMFVNRLAKRNTLKKILWHISSKFVLVLANLPFANDTHEWFVCVDKQFSQNEAHCSYAGSFKVLQIEHYKTSLFFVSKLIPKRKQTHLSFFRKCTHISLLHSTHFSYSKHTSFILTANIFLFLKAYITRIQSKNILYFVAIIITYSHSCHLYDEKIFILHVSLSNHHFVAIAWVLSSL